jgi:hypothetical protein
MQNNNHQGWIHVTSTKELGITSKGIEPQSIDEPSPIKLEGGPK